jgi:hypothetical protein
MEGSENLGVARIVWLVGLVLGLTAATVRCEDTTAAAYGPPRHLGNLSNPEVNESSGLAVSWRRPGVFWTHNDSGDVARIFALDATGKHLGECRIRDASVLDCEDIASFQWQEKSWLLLADVGDNARRRSTCGLFLFEEPEVTAGELDAVRVDFRYEDGPQDCEAIGVDVRQRRILLATKMLAPQSRIYHIELPELLSGERPLVARFLATVPVPMATALDIASDGRLAIFSTYLDGFLYVRGADESWENAFRRAPLRIPLPLRRQGESVCFGHDNRTLYLTSEKLPTPLWEVPVAQFPASP